MMPVDAPGKRPSPLVTTLLLALSFLMYFGIGLTNLNLPGLQYDEAADAVPAMELLRGQPNTAFSTINVFGQRLPLMLNYYIGPSSIYTSFLGMSVLGTTVAGLRISQLLVGAI